MPHSQYTWNAEGFQAMSREAALAAEHIAIGVSALSEANYGQKAHYYQAFFDISIGFERTCKLALILDYAITSGGNLPSQNIIRNYGHKLDDLIKKVDAISARYNLSISNAHISKDQITRNIIKVLTDFADNNTRYYNLDFLTSSTKSTNDSISSWYNKVTKPILAIYYKKRYKSNAEKTAWLIGKADAIALVRYSSESSNPITSLYDGSLHLAETDFANAYARMYIMRVARFLSYVISELSKNAGSTLTNPVPDFSEFFAIFNNEDKYFRYRKKWSIYKS